MGIASEFKAFALKGNVVDLAVGVIIGAAFGKIVDSVVKDLIMPLVGSLFGGMDFSNDFVLLADPPSGFTGPKTYEALTKAGLPLFAYGNFITVAVSFLILAFIIFLMVRKINRLKQVEPPAPAPATPEGGCCCRSATRWRNQHAGRHGMFGYYTLYATNDDRFMFNLKAGNHEVILTSQVYGSRQSALAGIQSMRNNSQLESRYERRASNDGPAYFLLRANNGQIIAQSVMYTGLLALEKGIDSAISHGPSQNIEIHV